MTKKFIRMIQYVTRCGHCPKVTGENVGWFSYRLTCSDNNKVAHEGSALMLIAWGIPDWCPLEDAEEV